MHFITSEEQLRTYIPNIIQTVPGEISIYDKMLPFLNSSENWVVETFLGEKLSTKLIGSLDPDGIPSPRIVGEGAGGERVCHIIALDAFMHAIPSLDLILTPNGFGIVSNNTIAPASKERVERLIAQLEQNRDNEINALLRQLPSHDEWLQTEQAAFFSSTLFPTLDICRRLGITLHIWDSFLQLQEEVLAIEYELEEDYIGTELMQVLRFDSISKKYTSPLHRRVIGILRTYVVEQLRKSRFKSITASANPRILFDVVNIIRDNPDTFPEWHESRVAELFTPPIFENKKGCGGYFF